MKVSFIAASLIAIGASAVAAMPSYRDSDAIRMKSHFYKQIAKLIFEEEVEQDEKKCTSHYSSLQCCRSFDEYENDDGKSLFRGIDCWFVHPGQTCKDIGFKDHKESCCGACTRTLPSLCFACNKPWSE